jgi:hypothetical protein
MNTRKNKKGNLKRAERKIYQFRKKEWYGCLTPCEIIALFDDGAKVANHRNDRDYYQDLKNQGFSSLHNFYFFPSKQQEERWTK